jgi:hypothetical protein
MKYHVRKALIGLIALNLPLLLQAEAVENGSGQRFETVCEALQATAQGGVVTVYGRTSVGSDCAWTTPGITVRGSGEGASIQSDESWVILANDTTIENIAFVNSGVEQAAQNLTLRGVQIQGAKAGVKTSDTAGGTLTIERSEISGNGINIQAGKIQNFILLSSYISNATGDSIVVQAASVQIRGNRLVSNIDGVGGRQLVLSADSAISLIDNLLLKTAGAAATPFVQYISETDQAGPVEITNNTFVSQLHRGAPFIEVTGEAEPAFSCARNIFWGQGSLDSRIAAAQESNYFGFDDIFAGESDFRLNQNATVADWGANVSRSESFPFVVPTPEEPAAATFKAEASRSLLASGVSQVVLKTSQVTGASLLFGNVVRLAAPAPSTGTVVSLSSSNPAVAVPWTSYVKIAAGQSTGTFILKTLAQTSTRTAIITASAGTSASAQISVGPISIADLDVQSSSIGSGMTLLENRVVMSGAVSTNTTIYLSSSSPVLTVPSSLTIAAAGSSNGFTVKAGFVSSPVNVTITARHSSGSKSVTVTVMPVTLSSAVISPSYALSGNWTGVKLVLNGPAPSGGLPVTLVSSNPGVYPIVSSTVIPAGKVEHLVATRVNRVYSNTLVKITAIRGTTIKSATVTVLPY